jgi:hypothetical protein
MCSGDSPRPSDRRSRKTSRGSARPPPLREGNVLDQLVDAAVEWVAAASRCGLPRGVVCRSPESSRSRLLGSGWRLCSSPWTASRPSGGSSGCRHRCLRPRSEPWSAGSTGRLASATPRLHRSRRRAFRARGRLGPAGDRGAAVLREAASSGPQRAARRDADRGAGARHLGRRRSADDATARRPTPSSRQSRSSREPSRRRCGWSGAIRRRSSTDRCRDGAPPSARGMRRRRPRARSRSDAFAGSSGSR